MNTGNRFAKILLVSFVSAFILTMMVSVALHDENENADIEFAESSHPEVVQPTQTIDWVPVPKEEPYPWADEVEVSWPVWLAEFDVATPHVFNRDAAPFGFGWENISPQEKCAHYIMWDHLITNPVAGCEPSEEYLLPWIKPFDLGGQRVSINVQSIDTFLETPQLPSEMMVDCLSVGGAIAPYAFKARVIIKIGERAEIEMPLLGVIEIGDQTYRLPDDCIDDRWGEAAEMLWAYEWKEISAQEEALTIADIKEKYGKSLSVEVVKYYPGGHGVLLAIGGEKYLVSDDIIIDVVEGWNKWINDPNVKLEPGQARLTILSSWLRDEDFACLQMGSKDPIASTWVDPASLEGVWVEGVTEDICLGDLLILADGSVSYIPDGVVNYSSGEEGAAVSGYGHYEWDTLWLSSNPRDAGKDAIVAEYAQQLREVVPDWPDYDLEVEGPIESCLEIEEYTNLLGVSPNEFKWMCGYGLSIKYRFQIAERGFLGNRYVVWSGLPMTQVISSTIYDRLDYAGMVFEALEDLGACGADDGTEVSVSYLTQGEVYNFTTCVNHGQYLNIFPPGVSPGGDGGYIDFVPAGTITLLFP